MSKVDIQILGGVDNTSGSDLHKKYDDYIFFFREKYTSEIESYFLESPVRTFISTSNIFFDSQKELNNKLKHYKKSVKKTDSSLNYISSLIEYVKYDDKSHEIGRLNFNCEHFIKPSLCSEFTKVKTLLDDKLEEALRCIRASTVEFYKAEDNDKTIRSLNDQILLYKNQFKETKNVNFLLLLKQLLLIKKELLVGYKKFVKKLIKRLRESHNSNYRYGVGTKLFFSRQFSLHIKTLDDEDYMENKNRSILIFNKVFSFLKRISNQCHEKVRRFKIYIKGCYREIGLCYSVQRQHFISTGHSFLD